MQSMIDSSAICLTYSRTMAPLSKKQAFKDAHMENQSMNKQKQKTIATIRSLYAWHIKPRARRLVMKAYFSIVDVAAGCWMLDTLY